MFSSAKENGLVVATTIMHVFTSKYCGPQRLDAQLRGQL